MHPTTLNLTAMLLNYILVCETHLTKCICKNIHTNRPLSSPALLKNCEYDSTIIKKTRFSSHVWKLCVTTVPYPTSRKIALVYYYAVTERGQCCWPRKGLQCNCILRAVPLITLYFIPGEYIVSFVVRDLTLTLRRFRMA
jgi:hypothetical protein